MPRLGAFEVSTVAESILYDDLEQLEHDHKREILFFSKMMSSMWPHAGALGERITEYAAEPAVNPRDAVSSLQ